MTSFMAPKLPCWPKKRFPMCDIGQVSRVRGAAGARFDLVAPQAPPLHEKRVQALHFVIAAGQQQQLAVTAQRPDLQGIGHGALAQGPVGKVGVAEDELAELRRRSGGMGDGIAHCLPEGFTPLQGALRQCRQTDGSFAWHGAGHS